MARMRLLLIVVTVLLISWLVLGLSASAWAETLNYKYYMWMAKREAIPVNDVEGHIMSFYVRSSIYVFDNGEVATGVHTGTSDLINGSGSLMQYVTITFADGSTIIMKSQGMLGDVVKGMYTASGLKSEIIAGTGRFKGITGTQVAKAKYLAAEKGELGPKGHGEGAITYTLPSK